METLQVVTVSSDNYVKYTAVMLTSLLVNKESSNPINIYVIGSISEKNQLKLNQSVERFGIVIKFFEIDPALFENFKLTQYYKQEVYYRLLIPDLLEPEIKKAIYLDSDLIIRHDITNLWNIDIENYFLAASRKSYLRNRRRALSIPYKYGCFNAGVMVINLNKWREHNVYQLVIDYLIKNEKIIRFQEQDALNGVLYNKYRNFDKKWNLTTTDLKLLGHKKINPSIIHYTGRKKPWRKGHRYQFEYFKYLEITHWNED